MTIRAVIFDIYNTLLQVTPAIAGAEDRWNTLWQIWRNEKVPMPLAEFDRKGQELIAAENAAARERGIAYPEVFWPQIARAILPKLASLTPQLLDDFLYQHAQLERSVRLDAGAAKLLGELVERGVILGLCSNCQPYTLRELADALSGHTLSMGIFRRSLCFFSFKARFSKPDPAVFLHLEKALKDSAIAPEEALLVGDRLDNDILPARARGWQTWHLGGLSSEPGGDWEALSDYVQRR